MTTRLKGPYATTNDLLGAILGELNQDRRCMFLVEPGCGAKKIQAVRMALTRVRNKMRSKNKRLKHFNMHASVHPHTEDGKRFDMVVVWRSQSVAHKMIETLEDLTGTGAAI